MEINQCVGCRRDDSGWNRKIRFPHRSTLAEVIAQALETGSAQNMDFTCVNAKGAEPTVPELRERLAALG